MGRAALLLGLAMTTFVSQAMWVTFSPVLTQVSEELGVPVSQAGLLAITYPVLLLVLTVPSGLVLDRAFGRWLLLAAVLTDVGEVLRYVDYSNYTWLMLCQLMGAVGQPFLLNSFVPFASRVYPEKGTAVISGLSLSMYLGVIYALYARYPLYSLGGVPVLLLPLSIASITALLLVLLGARSLDPSPRGRASLRMREAAGHIDLWLLGIILGLGVATFDNMATWLEPTLNHIGLGPLRAPRWVPHYSSVSLGQQSLYIRSVSLVITAFYITLAMGTDQPLLMTLLPLSGLLMVPAYPVIMDRVRTLHDPGLHGTATGLLGLVSRLISVAMLLMAPAFIGTPFRYFMFLAALTSTAFVVSLILPRR